MISKQQNLFKEITSGEEEICNTSIRSGQVIEAKGRSVIIFGNVNSGAEIRAGRSIYVFGNINGRVFAGCDSPKPNLERITFFGGKPEALQIGNLLITADDLANATFTKPMVATIVSSTINLSEI
ncbi:septum site-determining protein MinC [Photobacterium leiognathi]|uniref:septum site-determining protein MinC n=1 Tax=Photobacterium leiognathi TaxID=553611 RepID=UPI001EDE726B|nr:septum site-determining protein MinC [Photobacterium leiognathi]MCG3883730.1 septum site-determining protein MinC [Photobacterium leiognathi]